MARSRDVRTDPKFDAAIKAVQQTPSDLSSDDVERPTAYGRYARAPIAGLKCEAPAYVGGSERANTNRAQLARPSRQLRRGYSDTALVLGNIRPYSAKRRRVGPLQTEPEACAVTQIAVYECDLPVEMQYAVMKHLVETSPRAALALGATGRQQAALLEAIASTARAGTGNVDNVRTAAALGVDAASSIDVAVALCLLQGLAEFRATQGIDTVGGREECPGGATVTGRGRFDDLVERVAADHRFVSTRDRAQVWYQWLTTSPFDRVGQEKTRIEVLYGAMVASFRGIGKFGALDLLRMSQTGVEAGKGALVPDLSLAVQPIAVFVPPYERLVDILDGALKSEQLNEWAGQGWLNNRVAPNPNIVQTLGSDRIYRALARFIDEGVRAHLTRLCAAAARRGCVVVPDFTTAFDTRLYLVPLDDHIALMADIGASALLLKG